MKRFCLTLDLKDDAALIEEYEKYHEQVWPAILESIRNSGITSMEIYRYANRLCMMIETADNFSFEQKKIMDNANGMVQKWEELMWKYQQALPGAPVGEKWIQMKRIFEY